MEDYLTMPSAGLHLHSVGQCDAAAAVAASSNTSERYDHVVILRVLFTFLEENTKYSNSIIIARTSRQSRKDH